MPLKRENFTVYLNGTDDGDPTEQLTQITHQDMLRGEAELVRSGAADNARLALVTAWCWASLVRGGHYTGPWSRFRDVDCAGVEREELSDVDPTQEADPSGLPSS
jgi:hypothetical protein